MSVTQVRQRWGTFTALMKTMFVGINHPENLAAATGVIGPLPEQPADWGDWVNACQMLLSLEDAVHVTDAALRQANAVVVATNELAAAVKLPAPTEAQVASVVQQLRVVNERIKQHERFRAALAIGLAVAGEVEQRLRQP